MTAPPRGRVEDGPGVIATDRPRTVLALDAGQLAGDAERLRRLRTSRLPVDPGALRRASRLLRAASYSAKVAAERLEHRAHVIERGGTP